MQLNVDVIVTRDREKSGRSRKQQRRFPSYDDGGDPVGGGFIRALRGLVETSLASQPGTPEISGKHWSF